MTPEQFCYWLQGMLEVSNPNSLDTKHTQAIKDHLALVFKKVTPEYKPVAPLPYPAQNPLVVPPIFDRKETTIPLPWVLPQGPYC